MSASMWHLFGLCKQSNYPYSLFTLKYIKKWHLCQCSFCLTFPLFLSPSLLPNTSKLEPGNVVPYGLSKGQSINPFEPGTQSKFSEWNLQTQVTFETCTLVLTTTHNTIRWSLEQEFRLYFLFTILFSFQGKGITPRLCPFSTYPLELSRTYLDNKCLTC